MPWCLIKGCNNKSFRKSKKQEEIEKKQKITFHKFPKNEDRRKLWCKTLQLPENSLQPTSAICSMHFNKEDFDTSSLNCIRLKVDAIPYLSSQVSSMKKKSLSKDTEEMRKEKYILEKLLPDDKYHIVYVLNHKYHTEYIQEFAVDNIFKEHQQINEVQSTDVSNIKVLLDKETVQTKNSSESSNVIGSDIKQEAAQSSSKVLRATSVPPCNIYNSLNEIKLREELKRTKEYYKLRLKTETQKIRRMKKKIASMKNVLETIKRKNFSQEKQLHKGIAIGNAYLLKIVIYKSKEKS